MHLGFAAGVLGVDHEEPALDVEGVSSLEDEAVLDVEGAVVASC